MHLSRPLPLGPLFHPQVMVTLYPRSPPNGLPQPAHSPLHPSGAFLDVQEGWPIGGSLMGTPWSAQLVTVPGDRILEKWAPAAGMVRSSLVRADKVPGSQKCCTVGADVPGNAFLLATLFKIHGILIIREATLC